MSKLSLGYQDDTTLSKTDVAKVQLVEAIALFVQTKFLCAITLAGAAEEILGKLLQRQAELSAMRASLQRVQQLRDVLGSAAFDRKCEKQIVDGWNAARNTLKHFDRSDNEVVTLNLCDEAYWMIRRALANARKLGLTIANEHEFDNWVVENVNM